MSPATTNPNDGAQLPSQSAVKAKRIALFANHLPGLDVAKFLQESSSGDQVCALYVTGHDPLNDARIIDAFNITEENVFIGADAIKQSQHIAWFKEQKFDVLICVYWPWLLDSEIFTSVNTTINFHPALLPINRGWFPHVHSLLDGSKTGVTLHKIEDGADTGSIWAQKEVEIQATDTAKEIYDRLQTEIVDLFKGVWEDIKNSKIQAKVQDEALASYHAKNEISTLDNLSLAQNYTAKKLINTLRARSFGDRGFAFYEENGEKVYLNLRLSKTNKFD